MKIIESNRTVIGLILLGLIVMIYSYYTKRPIFKDNLIEIEGHLKDNPKLITWGGDMPSYEIELNLMNYEKKDFSLVNCGYDLINEKYILELQKGTKIKLYTDQLEFRTDNDVKIYSLLVNEKLVFSLNDYNKCYINYWKRVLPKIIIMLILLIFRVIYGIIQTEKINGWD